MNEPLRIKLLESKYRHQLGEAFNSIFTEPYEVELSHVKDLCDGYMTWFKERLWRRGIQMPRRVR